MERRAVNEEASNLMLFSRLIILLNHRFLRSLVQDRAKSLTLQIKKITSKLLLAS